MQEEEDYELVPAKKVQELQEQLDALKRNPLGSTQSGTDMISSMNKLSRTMDEMLSLFKDAAMQMQSEDVQSSSAAKKTEPLMERLDAIIEQNHKIAKGILAVADMLKDQMKHQRHAFNSPPRISIYPNQPMQRPQEDVFGTMTQPSMMQQNQTPSMSFPSQMPSMNLPSSGPMFPPSSFPSPSGMMAGPARTLPPAPLPPSFMMGKKREAPF